MTNEYEHLKDEFIKSGDVFVKNGMNYPKHEVNYEQSIVARALQFLLQLYIETGIRKYFDEAQRQLPVLKPFNGCQPSYYLHDISIRHWDGYWFGNGNSLAIRCRTIGVRLRPKSFIFMPNARGRLLINNVQKK